jgi:hypothetical protein
MYEQLLKVFEEREDRERHWGTDCSLLLDQRNHEEYPTLFFYSIAHILRHWCRWRAECLNSETTEHLADEDLYDLAFTVGWADEFLWLSVWQETRKLSGPPDIDTSDPYRLLFQALLQLEWADLIREAAFYRRSCLKKLFDTPPHANRPPGLDRFEIWLPRPDSILQNDLYSRATLRFHTAESAINRLETCTDGPFKLARNSDDFKNAINHRKQAMYLGLARISFAQDQKGLANGYLKEAAQSCSGGFLDDIIEAMLNKSLTNDWNFITAKGLIETEHSIHILAGWIKDLLKDRANGLIHPRLSLPKEDTPKGGVRQFPNKDEIDRLRKRIVEHIPWLRFVISDASGYMTMIERIEHNDHKLHERLYGSDKPGRSPYLGEAGETPWELFILRDWGSYTPLLWPGPEKEKSRGGGYFIRRGQFGIVIDPGYDFVDNFYAAGFVPRMITHVLVTHDHYDHMVSFGPLLNLLFMDIKEQGILKNANQRKIHFFLSRGVLDQYARYIVDFGFFGDIHPLTDKDGEMGRKHLLSQNPCIEVMTTHTEHGNSDGFGKGVGLVFSFGMGMPTIGITSDTGWFDRYELSDSSLCDIFEQHCPNVMLLHVGSLKREELQESGFYRKHLGARGVFRSIEAIKSCHLALLSEFGEECGGYRAEFADKINNYFVENGRKDFRCLPSDRMTHVVATKGGFLIGRHDEELYDYLKVEVKDVNGAPLLWTIAP